METLLKNTATLQQLFCLALRRRVDEDPAAFPLLPNTIILGESKSADSIGSPGSSSLHPSEIVNAIYRMFYELLYLSHEYSFRYSFDSVCTIQLLLILSEFEDCNSLS